MSKYWTHAAALLIGITLSVGFYEGRKLVYNTAEALSVASQLGSSDSRRSRRARTEAPEPIEVEPGSVAQTEEEPTRPKRRSGKKRRNREKLAEEFPEELAAMRAMRHQRRIERLSSLMRPVEVTDPIRPDTEHFDRSHLDATLEPGEEPLDEELLDTGIIEE